MWLDETGTTVLRQPLYVTPADAGAELGLSDAHVRRLCAAGRIEGAQKTWGGLWMVPSPVVYVDRKQERWSGVGRDDG